MFFLNNRLFNKNILQLFLMQDYFNKASKYFLSHSSFLHPSPRIMLNRSGLDYINLDSGLVLFTELLAEINGKHDRFIRNIMFDVRHTDITGREV